MAVCEHCYKPMTSYDKLVVWDGYSYHKKCHKCYVCSETNLHNAEIFKGVIFCSGCSQRIFQGCSTARKNKERSRDRHDSRRRRSHRTKERVEKSSPTRIIELAGMTALSASSRSSDNPANGESKSLVTMKERAMNRGKPTNEMPKSMKKSSTEMGTTTEVTQELLRQMHCPVVDEHKYDTYCTIQTIVRKFCAKSAPDKTGALTSIFKEFCSRYYGVERKRPDTSKRIVFEGIPASRKSVLPKKPPIRPSRYKKKPCSDLRIAELGTSTEIANMALKHRSELPVIIRTECHKPIQSESESAKNESDRNEQSLDSTCSTLEEHVHWSDRRFTSIIKIPIKSFKRNILDRSSLVDLLLRAEDRESILNRIKLMFHEEVNDHQKRGLKRLYSTINRQQPPHKLGWLRLIANIYCNANHDNMFRVSKGHIHKRCKHFKASHSYRCMRAHVMRLAGPTKSELAAFRGKVKQLVSPGFTLSAIKRKRSAILVSLGCGNSPPTSMKA